MNRRRIAVIGNCQVTTLSRVLQLYAPSATVVRIPFRDFARHYPTRDIVCEELPKFDLIFTQPFGPAIHPTANTTMLRDLLTTRVSLYPAIIFRAFHPDCVYAWHRDRSEFVESPMGDYHSALALLGHTLGFRVEETLRLFQAGVFERLGYFNFWKPSEESLFEDCQAIDFPVLQMYRSWVRRGLFMHSINHPKMFVLADVARMLLEKSGCFERPCVAEDFLVDTALCDPVWPVYPEIAEAMSLPGGGYIFKCGSRTEHNTILSLDNLVAESYERYDKEPARALMCSRVDEWIADAGLLEFLRERVRAS